MKKILITILLLSLTGCQKQSNFGAGIDITTASKMQDIINYQKSFIESEKYKQVLPTKIIGTDITYWVNEYIDGNGEKGFEIYYKKSDGTMMATGVGSEAIQRSFEWTSPSVGSTSAKEIK